MTQQAPRDWSTVAQVLGTQALVVAGLYFLQEVIWDHSDIPHGGLGLMIATAGGVLWCVPVIPGVLSNLGMLLQRKDRREPVGEPLRNVVSFRYMSRGTNPDSLYSSIKSVHQAMERHPFFRYVVEVCVEVPQPYFPPRFQARHRRAPSAERSVVFRRYRQRPSAGEMIELVIPPDYRTRNGTLFKGRAMQFALEQSELPDDGWIMHCDEESHIDSSLIYGIYHAIREEEASGAHRIGQGAILYFNSLEEHPFLTLADSVRTGDDIGRFHLQNRYWHLPVWGFHGSFILVRNSVEKRTGFDFGPDGSITEDAFWALAETEMGARSRWVDGYMIEQGTERPRDFLKQRRRWYVGLWKCVLHAPCRWPLRLPLAIFTSLWSVSWLAIIYTYVNYALGWKTDPVAQAIGNISFASYVVIYTVGLRHNLRLYPVSLWRRIRLYAAQILFLPLFAALESLAVLYALVRPETGFHVVQKNMKGPERAHGEVQTSGASYIDPQDGLHRNRR
jgi:egghead protein (zeste-white 4 protein)